MTAGTEVSQQAGAHGSPVWPQYRRARELVGSVFPASEQVILSHARKYGIGRQLGRTILFSRDDCIRLYEVLPCPSSSLPAPSRPSGSSAGQSAESALKKVLELTTEKPPKT